MITLLTMLRWAVREWRKAKRSGYFYKLCPHCGRPFSGAEVMALKRPQAINADAMSGSLVCGLVSCQRDAYTVNESRGLLRSYDPLVNPLADF